MGFIPLNTVSRPGGFYRPRLTHNVQDIMLVQILSIGESYAVIFKIFFVISDKDYNNEAFLLLFRKSKMKK
jgi:hypothetical protein